jgi:TolA-binding protein
MLKPYKKISKQELKQDKFVTYTLKAKEYAENNTRLIMWGGIFIVVVILVLSYLAHSKSQANLNANDLLTRATMSYEQGNIQQGEQLLQQLVDDYAGVTAAGQGCFYLAKIYWQQNDFANAKIYFRKYLDDYKSDDLLTSAAYAGYGDCLLEEGNVQEAALNYEKAAQTDTESPQAPSFYYSAASAFLSAKDYQNARKVASIIVEKYDQSEYKTKAEILLNMIKMEA